MGKRRKWWIFAGLSAFVLFVGFWPRYDEFAFLRGLHPIESIEPITFYPPNKKPRFIRRFSFTQPVDEVEKCIVAHWRRTSSDKPFDGTLTDLFDSPEHPDNVMLGLRNSDDPPNIICSLSIWEIEPTWTERFKMRLDRWFGKGTPSP